MSNPTTPEQKAKATARQRAWVAANRDRHNENVRAYRRKRYEADGKWRDDSPKATALKTWMIDIKSEPCADCGGTFEICCMDFDHREGTEKTYNVGSMFAHHYSRELIESEVAKCDLVCANCHRIRTRDRRTGSKLEKQNGIRAIPKDSPTQAGNCPD